MKALGVLLVIIGVVAGLIGFSHRLPGGNEEIDQRTAGEINKINQETEAVLRAGGRASAYTPIDNPARREWQDAKKEREQTMMISYIVGGVSLLLGLLIINAAQTKK